MASRQSAPAGCSSDPRTAIDLDELDAVAIRVAEVRDHPSGRRAVRDDERSSLHADARMLKTLDGETDVAHLKRNVACSDVVGLPRLVPTLRNTVLQKLHTCATGDRDEGQVEVDLG